MIFVITVLHLEQNRQRTWGYFETFEEAESAVIQNQGDIYENGYYDTALIEQFEPGVMAIALPENNHWYSVRPCKNHPLRYEYAVEPRECPEKYAQVFNIGMG